MNKNIICIALIIIVAISIYAYMNISNVKNSIHQSISDRYYYFNLVSQEGEASTLSHISSMLITDIQLIGEGKISINDFSNTFQHIYLCSKHTVKSQESLLYIFNKKEHNDNDSKAFLDGLSAISEFCKR